MERSVAPRGEPDAQSTENMDSQTLVTMRRQEALEPLTRRIHEEAHKDPTSGFVSVGFFGDGIFIYWKGDLSPGMRQIVESADAAGIVVVRPAPYSMHELQTAATKLGEYKDGTNLQSIKIPSDGSRLVVERIPPEREKTYTAASGRPLVDIADKIAGLDFGVPITLVTADTSPVLATCAGACRRTDDEAWWNGGGKLLLYHSSGPAYAQCTSGFAVLNGDIDLDDDSFLLTAAHCLSYGDYAKDGAGEYIGHAREEDYRHDLILLDARGWRWIWDGTATTTNYKTVHSWGFHDSGELLCQSGSVSGTVCSLETQYWILPTVWPVYPDSDGDQFWMYDMAEACKTDSGAPGQQGDSGGPVFSLDGSGVRAKGIVSGFNGAGCLLYQDMDSIIYPGNSWPGVTPYTG